MRLTFVRHGQTPDNAQRLWQGWGGRGLSEVGRRQAGLLGTRLASRTFTRVLSSDIDRVMETSAVLGKAVEVDRRWREIDVGSWAGASIPATWDKHPDVLDALRRGEDIRVGGDGESISEFHDRVERSVTALVAEHDEGDDVLIVTHGGVIGGLTATVFGAQWPMSPTAPIQNTSITTFEVGSDGALRLEVLNDDTHLSDDDIDVPDWLGDVRTVTLVRHGQSVGNLSDVWEGQTCSGLSEEGHRQAARLADWRPAAGTVISSDTERARETARYLANGSLETAEGLRELDMGAWSGLPFEQIRREAADVLERIYGRREDLPRGGSGESWSELAARMSGTVRSLLDRSDGDLTIVSHGSAIRAYVLAAMGLGWEAVPSLGLLPNTGLATMLVSRDGQRLRSYGVAPHR